MYLLPTSTLLGNISSTVPVITVSISSAPIAGGVGGAERGYLLRNLSPFANSPFRIHITEVFCLFFFKQEEHLSNAVQACVLALCTSNLFQGSFLSHPAVLSQAHPLPCFYFSSFGLKSFGTQIKYDGQVSSSQTLVYGECRFPGVTPEFPVLRRYDILRVTSSSALSCLWLPPRLPDLERDSPAPCNQALSADRG